MLRAHSHPPEMRLQPAPDFSFGKNLQAFPQSLCGGGESMSHLVTFQIEGGPSVVVETDAPDLRAPIMRGGRPAELATETGAAVHLALDGIRDAAQAMLDRLSSLPKAPDELTLEFGIKLSAEAGAVIAKAATEAHFAVTMSWKRTT